MTTTSGLFSFRFDPNSPLLHVKSVAKTARLPSLFSAPRHDSRPFSFKAHPVSVSWVMSQLSRAAEVVWLLELTATIRPNSAVMSAAEEAGITHFKAVAALRRNLGGFQVHTKSLFLVLSQHGGPWVTLYVMLEEPLEKPAGRLVWWQHALTYAHRPSRVAASQTTKNRGHSVKPGWNN